MRSEASPYAILGLHPGADATDVERAYKRLIKLHHPDRDGGDPGRAAEINRAYRELMGPYPPHHVTLSGHGEDRGEPRAWLRVPLILLVTVGLLVLAAGPSRPFFQAFQPTDQPQGKLIAAAPRSDVMNQPINRGAVTEAIREARRISASRDNQALLDASGQCHERLRLKPGLSLLDRCAAFDDAVIQLQDRDPMWDQGPFSEVSVTGRQWSAASSLSKDSLAIDSRLDRIRLQVELALAPANSN